MKKMYTNKPLVENEEVTFDPASTNYDSRIERLESTVRQLSEQLNKVATALSLNSRQIRRTNTDINNLTTVVRNK